MLKVVRALGFSLHATADVREEVPSSRIKPTISRKTPQGGALNKLIGLSDVPDLRDWNLNPYTRCNRSAKAVDAVHRETIAVRVSR
jgi:hypothetical protein